jgi:hypothetical protein
MGSGIVAAGVVVGMLVVTQSAFGQGTGEPQTPTLRVLVLNQARVHPDMLRAAQADAASIYAAAGVRIVWHVWPAEGQSNGDFDVVVSIVRQIGTPKSARALDELTLGLAAVEPTTAGGRRGRMAWVFFDRIDEHAFRHHIRVSRLCGLVMAHEIGHVMLPAGHSERGVMRGTWELRSGLLEYFTDFQADEIRRATRDRTVP